MGVICGVEQNLSSIIQVVVSKEFHILVQFLNILPSIVRIITHPIRNRFSHLHSQSLWLPKLGQLRREKQFILLQIAQLTSRRKDNKLKIIRLIPEIRLRVSKIHESEEIKARAQLPGKDIRDILGKHQKQNL